MEVAESKNIQETNDAIMAQRQRDRMAERMRRGSAAISCIGTIPAVVNPARRESCRKNLYKFLSTYFPLSTSKKPFGLDQRRAIRRIQIILTIGGRFGQAFPRGGCKTSISENSIIWALLYGHRKFVPLFGAGDAAATRSIDSMMGEFETNDLLFEDFPEVCLAVRKLEGKAQRCGGQTHKPGDVEGRPDSAGELGDPVPTSIQWSGGWIVLPSCKVPQGWGTLKGPQWDKPLVTPPGAEGATISLGILSHSVRGMKFKNSKGENQRPDAALLDDIQHEGTAISPTQTSKLFGVVKKTVFGLGGPGKKMSVLCCGTVIEPDDFMSQLLDAKLNPSWQSERISMVKQWGPAKDTLWLGEYAKIRNTYDPLEPKAQSLARIAATDFYKKNRKAMDQGHETFWASNFDDEDEVSALQHAYNKLIDDGLEAFLSECQNQPLPRISETSLAPRPLMIAAKANGIPRGTVPRSHHMVICFIDVQKTCLPWLAMSFGAGFSGHIVDYGLWPAQPRGYVGLPDVKQTLQDLYGKELETSLMTGMAGVVDYLAAREFMREDGMALRVGKIGIDENWGSSTEFVHAFCRRSVHSSLLTPQDGRAYGPQSRGIEAYKVDPGAGERGGYGWILTKIRNSRHVVCDVNMWKSFVHRRLALPPNTPGGWTLFGAADTHDEFTQQACAEFPDEQSSKSTGRTVTLWQHLPNRQNHGLDLLVGCGAMASLSGISMQAVDGTAPVKRKFRTMAEMASGK